MISEELGLDLKDATIDQLGRAKSVKVEKESTVIVDGMGRERCNRGLELLRSELRLKRQHLISTEKNLQERLAKLAGGVAVIRVGAATETEMKEAKLRMEDALECYKSGSRRRNYRRWWICLHSRF